MWNIPMVGGLKRVRDKKTGYKVAYLNSNFQHLDRGIDKVDFIESELIRMAFKKIKGQ